MSVCQLFDICSHTALFFQTGVFCIIADNMIKSEIYSDYVQVYIPTFFFFFLNFSLCKTSSIWYFSRLCKCVNLQAHLAPSGYLKLPNVSLNSRKVNKAILILYGKAMVWPGLGIINS